MGKEFIEGIGQWNTNAKGLPMAVIFIVIAVGLLFIALMVYKKYTEVQREKSAVDVRFANLAREMSIEGELFQCLLKIKELIQSPNPVKLISNTFEFDEHSATYLKHLLNSGIKAGEYENALLLITKIRQRVAAKSKDNFKPINSTQDLYSGLDVQLVVKEGPHIGEYESKVASASKHNLVIHSPTLGNKKVFFENGTVAYFTFSREDDAVYQFSTHAIGKFKGSLAGTIFQNTEQITKIHVRKYTRVKPDFLIKVIGVVTSQNDIHRIQSLRDDMVSIDDISGGGMQINVTKNGKVINYLEPGKVVAFSIYIPEIGPVEDLKGRVVRKDLIEEHGYYITSIEFVDISSKNRSRILQGILHFLKRSKKL